ncbi:uncharacterized protein LOC117110468 [Anneissia japonica]|uniref:uncharacterized protein LOC117110468 n=1 Tax=Anneissia japonica TaxID=1529436 RepID=UPI0014257C1E|nr:uncharacterized protein LOC117110468 [Anneissia japonica]XP_033109071.1 uncharacterized protein LOC117110468 [Anneissia japonica]XP_033109072.1 uncharacterized protein LOC117110468 [Anneissia japonica]XP_033109073.1 uncharacterized protein LOC117110468 [Anneissia japonica]
MSTIPGSMFVAPGSCHTSLRKYHQIQKRQQSQEIDIPDSGIPATGSPRKATPASPIGSPTPPMSPLNKVYNYFRQFSNPSNTGVQEFQGSSSLPGEFQNSSLQSELQTSSLRGEIHASSLKDSFNFPHQDNNNSELKSPLNSPRSDSENTKNT